MSKNRFAELLALYLEGKATEGEQNELMQLIRAGGHDESLQQAIDAMLLDASSGEKMHPQATERMIERITRGDESRVVSIGHTSTPWRWVAAAAVLVISLAIGWWRVQTPQVSKQAVAIKQDTVRSVVLSGKNFVRLPDGSTVLLNERSELSYSPSFGQDDREVILSGEAYFDVTHNASLPFKVITGKITTTVLGTAFNVKAYPGQEEIKVTVTRGKVQVENERRTLGVITPDQQIAVRTTTLEFEQKTVNTEVEKAWQNQYLILDDVSLEEAARLIGKRYGVRIALANEQLKACRISATFLNGENLDQVLTVVSGVVQATYTMLPDGNARLEGKGCD